jgi:formylglycine-generating enzyme required for sulfatase activity
LPAAFAAQRYAFLVGVREYDKTQLNSLNFTENDVTSLADVLRQTGYREQEIVLMTQTVGATKTRYLPQADKIRKELGALLRQVGKDDSLLVAFSGHGVQFEKEEDLFFCPADADLKNRATLISLGEVYQDLEKCPAAVKLLLVDACRNDPLSKLAKSRRVVELETLSSAPKRDPPGGIAAFFSCSRGEQSFEHPDLKQGIFFHFVTSALGGAADFNKDQQVSLPELEQFAVAEVQRFARVELGVAQTPERRGQARGLVMVATVPRVAVTPRSPPEPVKVAATVPARPAPQPLANASSPAPAPQPRADDPRPNQPFKNSLGMNFAFIPAGEFLMGTSDEQDKPLEKIFSSFTKEFAFKKEFFAHERPQHKVQITKPFYLGIHEVTRGQFARFVQEQGYATEAESDGEGGYGYSGGAETSEGPKPQYNWRHTGFPADDDHPVVNVTWHDALEFCQWLSSKEKREYRLPTEAEWEYACRAGSTRLYHHGDDPEGLAEVSNVMDATLKAKFANTHAISARDGHVFTAPVGKFKANAFGLFDMHGNVREWCADEFDFEFYKISPPADPRSWSELQLALVIRGGSWSSACLNCRSASRQAGTLSDGKRVSARYSDVGFRVALIPSGK